MIFYIVVVLAAFWWLMYETNWLTIRLPFGKPLTGDILVHELLTIAIGLVVGYMVAGLLCKELKDSPADWYETVGFAGPEYGAWRRYVEADKQAKDEVQGVISEDS